MKKEINYKSVARDLLDILRYDHDDYKIAYFLCELGVSYDTLIDIGIGSDDAERAYTDEMNGVGV
jgi:hypothetical protein